MLQSLRVTGHATTVPATPAELAELAAATGQSPLPASLITRGGTLWFLAGDGAARRLIALVPDSTPNSPPPPGSPRRITLDGQACTAFISPLTPAAAAALRAAVPELAPRPCGLRTTAGFGDRLGLATPGHVAALRRADPERRIGPIFAQQSIRENARTGRTPQGVLDDATWGALAVGWTHGVGADADHLKQPADVDLCVAAGYSFFTIDPGDHVQNQAAKLSGAELRRAYE
ncbi:MAG TPA: tagaturonate epimerase family protein, partial [Limnochordia bacterium]|nr:tagaturonate epimerase family protein [Limnochordia bacterium]